MPGESSYHSSPSTLTNLCASGVASLLTTSEACVVEAPEEKAPPAGGMGGGMGAAAVMAYGAYSKKNPLSIGSIISDET